ncbi:D-alanyl-D-alanine carboxypeptidase [Lutibacter sp. A64]|uniref:D-alanyl-D-alanine carboxypeptidase n=1 Tax=Lutibacter sp. A64 TaxID=2918526 RepID=UPI001F051971|nr:D-alanyl-D-alanine carboxypeptidase [Lutibacter sp. A64]UMB55297.1 D-alanyl-D-alanine carboxypeptidase [Lutibacter sp. A64]
MLKLKFLCLALIFILTGCKSVQVSKKISKQLNSSFFENQFVGLLVYNPESNKIVHSYNAEKYFTPASNTKIFTLYTGLHYLPNKVPSFKYTIEKDTLNVIGTGDPTFLHSYFQDSTALKMFNNYEKINLTVNNIEDKKYGPGWAWEDYDAYFSPEKSSFPMYGNVLSINYDTELKTSPEALKDSVYLKPSGFKRAYNSNRFYYQPNPNKTREIPMVIDSLLINNLWNTLLPNKVNITNYSPKKMEHIAYSIETDSLYKRMMHESDNFLAEQILILASSTVSDTLNSNTIRKTILENQLSDLKQQPRWVDGSGLSRYNLFTPTSFVQVLTKLHNEIPKERLFNFFPIGGELGTLKNWYGGNPTPYVYAKSGSFGNNYCLSGYLITKSNKVLIFSFMNNHFKSSTNAVRQEIQTVLELLRDNY